MFVEAKTVGNGCSGLQFAPVSLALVEGEANDAVALLKGKGCSRGGIQPTREQRDRSALTHLRTVSS